MRFPSHRQLSKNFRAIDKQQIASLELSLRDNYFIRFPEEYLSTDFGKDDLQDHLFNRLETNRNMIVPWLDEVRPLQGTSILEIGCGTGASTVALAEQGAEVSGGDVHASRPE